MGSERAGTARKSGRLGTTRTQVEPARNGRGPGMRGPGMGARPARPGTRRPGRGARPGMGARPARPARPGMGQARNSWAQNELDPER